MVDVFVFARSLKRLKTPPSMRYFMSIEGVSGGILFIIADVYSEKQVGPRTHPCFKLPLMGNRSDKAFWWHTLPHMPSWRARTRPTKSGEQPNLARTAHIIGWGTLSKAFLRSQKMNMIGCCCSWLFWSCRAQKIMSIVPQEGQKPHWDSDSTSSAITRRKLRRMRAKILLAMLSSDIPQ